MPRTETSRLKGLSAVRSRWRSAKRRWRSRESVLPCALAAWVSLGGTLLVAQARSGAWPVVEAARSQKTFVNLGNGEDTPFLLVIKDTAGSPLYKLECHNGDYESRSVISFSGDFHCALVGVRGENPSTWNLLADNTPAQRRSDWFNRGRMMAYQLRGACATSVYGTTRVFRVRGMRLTFQFTDVEWNESVGTGEPKLKKFTFNVDVIPDMSAQTREAEVVAVPIALENCL